MTGVFLLSFAGLLVMYALGVAMGWWARGRRDGSETADD